MRLRRSLTAAVLGAAVLVGVQAPAAMAATIAVTTIDDVVDPNDGVISLREAFIIANSNETDDTIALAAGVEYELDSCFVGELPHTQDEDLIVDGNGSSIYQTCFDERVIHNTNPAASLTLVDVALTGGFVPAAPIDGAGVLSRGPLTLDGVTIVVINAGAGGSVVDGGDTFSGDDADITIIDSVISSNTGTAVVISGGPVTITGSEINNNTEGGVVLIDGRPLVVTDTDITDNGGRGLSTTGQGFALMSVTNSTIADNADLGVSCSQCSTVTITSSTITGNGTQGSSLGGGVAITTGYDDVANVYSFVGSTISGNVANRSGGGIRITGSSGDASVAQAEIVVTGTSLIGNRTAGFFDIEGGGIYAGTGNLTITGSTLAGNAAGPIGGLTPAKGGAVFLKDGAGLDDPPNLTITGSTLDGNSANSQGGGVYAVSDGAVMISESSLSGNVADGIGGGGLYAAGAAVTIERSTVAGNRSDVGGGVAIAEFSGFGDGALTVVESTISGNEATFGASGGGGVFVNVGDGGVDATFVNSTVSGNTSANFGGGIMAMQTSQVSLLHTTVVGNEGANGANVFVAAGALAVDQSVIAEPLGADNCDLGGLTVSGGFSFADDTSCNLSRSDVEAAIDPMLGPLAANGGPTATHLPASNGPLAGMVPVASCGVATDQRGQVRPQGSDCEPGATEIAEGQPVMIRGTRGADVLYGTPGPDIIYGLGGGDTIYGLDGDDVIIGGGGRDRIFGGGGRDELRGGRGGDTLNGGRGRDVLAGNDGADILRGRGGNDRLRGGDGNDLLSGGAGFDRLDGGRGRDVCRLGPDGGVAVRC